MLNVERDERTRTTNERKSNVQPAKRYCLSWTEKTRPKLNKENGEQKQSEQVNKGRSNRPYFECLSIFFCLPHLSLSLSLSLLLRGYNSIHYPSIKRVRNDLKWPKQLKWMNENPIVRFTVDAMQFIFIFHAFNLLLFHFFFFLSFFLVCFFSLQVNSLVKLLVTYFPLSVIVVLKFKLNYIELDEMTWIYNINKYMKYKKWRRWWRIQQTNKTFCYIGKFKVFHPIRHLHGGWENSLLWLDYEWIWMKKKERTLWKMFGCLGKRFKWPYFIKIKQARKRLKEGNRPHSVQSVKHQKKKIYVHWSLEDFGWKFTYKKKERDHTKRTYTFFVSLITSTMLFLLRKRLPNVCLDNVGGRSTSNNKRTKSIIIIIILIVVLVMDYEIHHRSLSLFLSIKSWDDSLSLSHFIYHQKMERYEFKL